MTEPIIDRRQLADAWLAVHDDDEAIVLWEQEAPEGVNHRTVDTQARRHLIANGWTLPDAVICGGDHFGDRGDNAFEAEWFVESFREKNPVFSSSLACIQNPSAFIGILERILADGVIPADGNGLLTGYGRLAGDQQAIGERVEGIEAAISPFELGGIPTSDDDAIELVTAALSRYVEFCLDFGISTNALQRAMAGIHDVEPDGKHTLLMVDQLPWQSTLEIAVASATETLTIVQPIATTGAMRTAWRLDQDGLIRWVNDRLETGQVDTSSVIPIEQLDGSGGGGSFRRLESDTLTTRLDPARCIADGWSVSSTDPARTAIELAANILQDHEPTDRGISVSDPAALCIVTPNKEAARRVARLAKDRSLPMIRSGPIDIFLTRLAILSLAWLRILEGVNADRGWAVVLEETGCSAGDLQAWLAAEERPAVFASIKSDLASLTDGPSVVAAVADRYHVDERVTRALLTAIDIDGPMVSKAAVLARLSTAIHQGMELQLRPTQQGSIRVRSSPPPEPTSVVLYLDVPNRIETPLIEYQPPLGVYRTREIITHHGYDIEQSNPAWLSMQPLRMTERERRRLQALTAWQQATGDAIIIGEQPVLTGQLSPLQ